MDVDNKGLNQLLLSPLYLFDQLLSTAIPGALFMLLLSFKGNVAMRAFWLQNVLGYKTKIAAFCILAFVVGHFIKLPLTLLASLRQNKEDISGLSEHLKKQTPEVRAMLKGMIIDGALLSMPGLMDRLSVAKAEAGFHLGTGLAFLLAAGFPGDGSHTRWFEAAFGLVLLWVGVAKAKAYATQTLSTVGVGLANIVGKLTLEQMQVHLSILKIILGGAAPTVEVPEVKPQPSDVASGAQSVT